MNNNSTAQSSLNNLCTYSKGIMQSKHAKEQNCTACDLEPGLVGYQTLSALSTEPAISDRVSANR